MFRSKDSGAIAAVAPYLLGCTGSGKAFIDRFYSGIYEDGMSLGKSFRQSFNNKKTIGLSAGYFILLGDPAIKL